VTDQGLSIIFIFDAENRGMGNSGENLFHLFLLRLICLVFLVWWEVMEMANQSSKSVLTKIIFSKKKNLKQTLLSKHSPGRE
jgi:hypothetical protein